MSEKRLDEIEDRLDNLEKRLDKLEKLSITLTEAFDKALTNLEELMRVMTATEVKDEEEDEDEDFIDELSDLLFGDKGYIV